MSISQPSPAELLHHHVKYEFDMLNGTFEQIGCGVANWTVANALIEAFCVHARALFEFFEKSRGARKYTDTAYIPFNGGDKARRTILTRKLNNQVSHVLDGRTANPAQKIGRVDQIEMHALLNAEFAKFNAHLLPTFAAPVSSPIMPTAVCAVTTTNDTVIGHGTNTNTVAPTKI